MQADRELSAIQRKLERWELEHLRSLAAALADQVEALEARLAVAEDAADHWREQALRIEAFELGLDVNGNLHVIGVRPDEAAS
jgi:hypothetical protein